MIIYGNGYDKPNIIYTALLAGSDTISFCLLSWTNFTMSRIAFRTNDIAFGMTTGISPIMMPYVSHNARPEISVRMKI